MLMRNRLQPVAVFRAEETDGGYVGTVRVWHAHGTVLADVQPTDGKREIAAYGARVTGMRTLYLPRDADICPGDGVVGLDTHARPTWRVVQVLDYSRHRVALIEKAVTADADYV